MSSTLERPSTPGFETLAVHGGHDGDTTTKSRAVPIYQTTSYLFDDTAHAARLFGLEELGNIYTRIGNPTTAVLEERVAALEGGIGALAVASGQAAVIYALATLARSGDHIVSSGSLYGGTFNAFAHTLPRFGINVSFVDADNDLDVRAAIRPNTKAIYAETIGNPRIDVLDIERLAAIAHEYGLPLVVDNTLASPYLVKPITFGADIVVHSATKFLGGHGVAVGGIIVDSGKFDWAASPRFAEFVAPDSSYHGLVYTQAFGPAAFIAKARVQLLRDVGAAISPFNSWLLLLGIETLALRLERHCENAQKIAEFLAVHPRVASVRYPGLISDSAHERARKYLRDAKGGAILSFQIHGDETVARGVIDRLRLFSLLANVGDAKSLVIHPASTTHAQLSPEDQRRSGIESTTIRLSIGIEDINDLLADLEQALRA